MGKREFTAFTDSFLKRAGQEYMSMQQIDNLKRQEKSAKENLDYQKKRHKEDTELDIAKLIVAARREATEVAALPTGTERLANVQADVLETRVEELDKLRAEGKISPQDYIDKLSMYSSYKRTHVTEDGGAGSKPEAVEALDKKISDLVGKVSSSSPSRDKFVALQGATSEEELEQIYKMYRTGISTKDIYGGTRDKFDAAYRYMKERFRKRGENVPYVEPTEKIFGAGVLPPGGDNITPTAQSIVDDYFGE